MAKADLMAELASWRASHVLILAVFEGTIVEMMCAMPECLCPYGRAHFDRKGDPRRGQWAPSADRWPVPGREGGEYVPSNVRLSHLRCNQVEGGRVGGLIGAPLTHAARRASGQYRSAEHRANCVLRAHAIPREAKVRGGQLGARHLAREARVRGGLAVAAISGERLRRWRSSPKAPAVLASAGLRGACQRWRIAQGQPCICRSHIGREV